MKREEYDDLITMIAYEQGHSCGISEVDSIEPGIVWDFNPIFTKLEGLIEEHKKWDEKELDRLHTYLVSSALSVDSLILDHQNMKEELKLTREDYHMSLTARKAQTSAKEQPEENTYSARLLAIVDMGHQPGFSDGNNTYESQWKLEFTYELVTTEMEDGRPFVVSEQMNNNDWEDTKTGRSTTLVARAKSLLGKDYKLGLADLTKMLGKPCMCSVTHNKNGYAQLKGASAIGSVPVGFDIKELHNETYTFSMDSPNIEIWDYFPEFKQERLMKALNFNETELARILAEGDQYK